MLHAVSARSQHPRLEAAMLVLALSMLPLIFLRETTTDPAIASSAETLGNLVWFAFVGEFLYLLGSARSKGQLVRSHWFDIAIIVLTPPVSWIPAEVQALRILRSLRGLRVLGTLAVLFRMNFTLHTYVRRGSVPYVVAFTAIIVFIGGIAIHELEPNTARSVGDGLWWAAVTVSTVGYGDIAPTTPLGRALAIVLIVVGLGAFAALTATIASFFVEAGADRSDSRIEIVEQQLVEIRRELRDIADRLP